MTTPYDAYTMYLGLKMHFTQDKYDYIKYNGKVRANPLSFDTRKDKYFFYKLSKKEDLLNFYVSNMLEKPNIWAGDLLQEKSEKIYQDWLKKQQGLTYHFETQTRNLFPDFNENLLVTNGQHPKLYKMFRQGYISIETLLILNEILNFFPHWNKEISDPVLWPSTYKLAMKYKPFLEFNKEKCKKALKNHAHI